MMMVTLDRVALGRRVRACRNQRGYSQEQLAIRAGLCRDTIAVIERGEGANLETFFLLLRALDADANALLGLQDAECRESPTAFLV
jgi:transcriptional regulator with XRE-family HTH domain